MTNAIYLDHNATTPIHPKVAEAIHECYLSVYGNPASPHTLGRESRRVLEAARDAVARLVGARTQGMDADHIFFNSGGAEANNHALRGLAGEPPARIIVSAIEHPTISGPAEFLRQQGFDVVRLRVLPNGVVDLNHLTELLSTPSRLVSVMLGNNETGVLQPIQKIALMCRQAGTVVHTDAVQAVGKIRVSFQQLGVDAMSFSGHKFHGPVGIGALVLRRGVTLRPLLFGGFQQMGLRPGTESVALAVGLRKALELWEQEADDRAERMTALRDRFEQLLRQADEKILISGDQAPRLPHTSNIAFRGLDRQALLMSLDMAGVACSTGSACASGSSEPSPVLLAMGCDEEVVLSSLRFSLGAFTTERDIEEAASRIAACVNRLRQNGASR